MNDFFAMIYEGIFYSQPFSNDMFNNNIYFTTGITFILICILFLFLYYKIIDMQKLAKQIIYWIVNLGVALINFIVVFLISYNEIRMIYNFNGEDIPYFSPFITFGLINAGLSFVLFFILSFIVRLLSNNSRYIPFGRF